MQELQTLKSLKRTPLKNRSMQKSEIFAVSNRSWRKMHSIFRRVKKSEIFLRFDKFFEAGGNSQKPKVFGASKIFDFRKLVSSVQEITNRRFVISFNPRNPCLQTLCVCGPKIRRILRDF